MDSDINASVGVDGSKKIVVEDIDAIKESILNIITTSRSTRLFRPNFWSALNHLLWQPVDEDTALDIMLEIDRVLGLWEPRVKLILERSVVTPIPEEHRFDITLVLRRVDTGEEFELGLDNVNQ